MNESILVVSDLHASGLVRGEGFVPAPSAVLADMLAEACFVPRPQAEGNPSLRQIIPYVALIRAGQAFAVERFSTQGETRLHGKLSIGIGGHMNERDVFAAAWRELAEELAMDAAEPGQIRFMGFINDLSSAVSRDHLGCLFVLPVKGEVSVREEDKMAGRFRSLSYLLDNSGRMEHWSVLSLGCLREHGLLAAESEVTNGQ